MLDDSISHTRFLGVLALIVGAVLVWSAIEPRDGLTWLLEASPVIIGAVILAATYRRFRLSRLAYLAVAAHSVILLIGAHYTYAEVPLFNWLRDGLGFERNHYDRIGHVAQGFFPAILAREILLRLSPVPPGKWMFFLVTSVCLAISAFYELIEWWVALIAEEGAVSFLGTQGDPWDTQWDMFLALLGAISAQWLLAGYHDRSLAKLRP